MSAIVKTCCRSGRSATGPDFANRSVANGWQVSGSTGISSNDRNWGGKRTSGLRRRFHDPPMQLIQIRLAVNGHTLNERLGRPSGIILKLIGPVG